MNRDVARGALAGFAVLLVVSEILCRFFVSSGGLARRVDVSGSLTSLAELRARARTAPRCAVGVLGDSVAGPTALLQNRVEGAREQSLTAHLARRLPVLSLSADGLLLPDLEGLYERLGKDAPANLLVLLNFRMFAASFEVPEEALSRDALLPESAADLRDARRRAGKGDALGRRLYETSARASAFFLVSQTLRARLLAPSRKDLVERGLARVLPAADDEDLTASVLRLKVAPFYEDRDWNAASPAFVSLRRLLSRRTGAFTVVALVPQNPVETASMSPARLAGNRALVMRAVEEAGGRARETGGRARETGGRARETGGRFLDLVDAFPESAFLDHCHLTGEGNARLAAQLDAAVGVSRK